MSESLTVTVSDGGTYTVDVRGVDLFTDTGLTSPASFPASVSATTTWYAADPTKPGRRQNVEVLVTSTDGTHIPVQTFNSLPMTVELPEGSLDASAPSSGGSIAVLSTFSLKTSGDVNLVDAAPNAYTFSTSPVESTGSASTDYTLESDHQTITIHNAGLYQISYATAVHADAGTVKATVDSYIATAASNVISDGNGCGLSMHLDGATSTNQLEFASTTPIVPFAAGDTFQIAASAFYTAGSAGNAVLEGFNNIMTITRLA